MSPQSLTNPQRIYYLDWLRVFAVLAVFIQHCGYIFDPLGDWFIKNDKTHLGFSISVGSIYFWVMPLFFFISGASTQRFLTHKSTLVFLQTRITRLLIPLAIGVIVIIPPQNYIKEITHVTFEGSYLEYYDQFIRGVINNSDLRFSPAAYFNVSGHLWFLLTLFFVSILCLPIVQFIKIKGIKNNINKFSLLLSKKRTLFLLSLPLSASLIILKPVFPTYTDWADFTYWMLFYIYGYIYISCEEFSISTSKHSLLSLFAIAIICLMAVYMTSAFCENENCFSSPSYTLPNITFLLLSGLTSWFFVLGFISLFRKKIKKGGALLNYCSNASFSFYYLHQTILIIVAYYLLQLNLQIFSKFLLITASSLFFIMLTYETFRRTLFQR